MKSISNKILKYLCENDDGHFKDVTFAFKKTSIPARNLIENAFEELSDKIELESVYNYRGILITDVQLSGQNNFFPLIKARISQKGREYVGDQKIKIGSFKIQKYGLYIALGTLFIAVLPFVSKYFRPKSGKDLLQMESVKINTETAIFYKTKNNLIIPHTWKATIVNNTEKPISILDYNLKFSNLSNIMYYSGIDQGLFDLEMNKLNLPFEIDPFKAKAVYIKIGILTDSIVTKALVESNIIDKLVTTRDIRAELARKNIDIFGNKVHAETINNAVIIKSSFSNNDRKFILKFRTSQNKFLPLELTYYPKLEDMLKSED